LVLRVHSLTFVLIQEKKRLQNGYTFWLGENVGGPGLIISEGNQLP
jgi:hypothetical protein